MAEQCNDRVHRIGQHRDVTVHLPLAIHPVDGPSSFDCLLQRLILKKRTLATDVLASMGEAEGDTDAIRNGLEAQYSIELPSFDTSESLASWVNERLENYLIKKTGDIPVADEAQVIVQLHHARSRSGSPGNHKSNRLIELFPDGPSRVETRRLEDGTLVTELGGAMLSLWPEAVLEPGDTVRVIA